MSCTYVLIMVVFISYGHKMGFQDSYVATYMPVLLSLSMLIYISSKSLFSLLKLHSKLLITYWHYIRMRNLIKIITKLRVCLNAPKLSRLTATYVRM